MNLGKVWARFNQSLFLSLEERVQARLQSGEVTEDTPLSSLWRLIHFDSLDQVELFMEVEEMEISTGRKLETVGDLIQLLKTINFRRDKLTQK